MKAVMNTDTCEVCLTPLADRRTAVFVADGDELELHVDCGRNAGMTERPRHDHAWDLDEVEFID